MKYVLALEEVSLDHLPEVGGKNASLGEIIRSLKRAGVRVPGGFALTVDAYRRHLEESSLGPPIHAALDELDVEDVRDLAKTAAGIRDRISRAHLPAAVVDQAKAAYERLSLEFGDRATDVAVRSSATAEDLPTASFAGQQETFLNVRGWEPLDRAIRGCMASLFTDRAIVYRTRQGIPHRDVSLSACVQKMIRSDRSCSGVLFTLDTESGFRDVPAAAERCALPRPDHGVRPPRRGRARVRSGRRPLRDSRAGRGHRRAAGRPAGARGRRRA